MKITVGENYAVEHDGVCVTLYRIGKTGPKSKTPGKETQMIIGYYPDMTQALHRLVEEKLSDSDAKDVAGLAEALHQTRREISERYWKVNQVILGQAK